MDSLFVSFLVFHLCLEVTMTNAFFTETGNVINLFFVSCFFFNSLQETGNRAGPMQCGKISKPR